MNHRSRPADGLALLGLAQRAGAVARGSEATRRAIRRGEARLLVLAADASAVQLEKIMRGHSARLRTVTVPTRAELGAALGTGPLSAVAVTRASFAKRLGQALDQRTVSDNE